MTDYTFTLQAKDAINRTATTIQTLTVNSEVPADPIAASIADKLRHWWDFDTDAVDIVSGNVLSGPATYGPGLIDGMVTKGSVLQSQPLSGMNPSEGVTFGGWIYIAGTADENPITLKRGRGDANSRSQAHYLAMRGSGTIMHLVGYPVNSSPATSPANSITPETFRFVVGVVHPDSTIQLYIDGDLVATSNCGVPLPSFDHLQFGRTPLNTYAALQNDASFIAQGVLTAEEVEWLYNDGAGRSGEAILPYLPARAALGAWTWFNEPRAIKAGDYLLVGSVAADGVIQATYSIDGFKEDRGRTRFSSAFSPNDHDNPGFLRRSDGKLLAFYCRHNDPSTWVRESTIADDPTDWGEPVNLQPQLGSGPFAYNNPVQLTGEPGGPIFNFFRRGVAPNWTMSYSKSLDGGGNWLAALPLLGAGRPYFKLAQNGNTRIDFAVTDGHPDSVATNSIRHFYYEGGDWFDSAGNDIGTPPFDTSSDLTTVYDGTTARAWVWDVQIGMDGYPRIVFATFPTNTDHRYHYARWTGSAWQVSEICAAGSHLYAAEPYYSGGVCIDPDDVSVVYASREDSGEWELWKFTTPDAGATWSGASIGEKGIRPYAVSGSSDLLVMSGRYTTFANFGTVIRLHNK